MSFSNPRVALDLSIAQGALAAAEGHYDRAARAAFQNRGNTSKYVLSTMREMEKGMTRHESAYGDSDSESKPQ